MSSRGAFMREKLRRSDCRAERRESVAGSGDRLIDHFVRVDDGNKAGFEDRRREVAARVEHLVEPAAEELVVRLHHVSKAVRDFRKEVNTEHAAAVVRRERNTVIGSRLREAFSESI